LLNACFFDKGSQEEYDHPCASDHDSFSHIPKNWFRNTSILWHLAVYSEYHNQDSCERCCQAKHIQASDS
jgi:hypothetical protein